MSFTPRAVVTVDPFGAVRVLTNSPDLQVAVLDQDIEGGAPHVNIGGNDIALDCLAAGLPRVNEAEVESVFNEIQDKLPASINAGSLGHQAAMQLTLAVKSWFQVA